MTRLIVSVALLGIGCWLAPSPAIAAPKAADVATREVRDALARGVTAEHSTSGAKIEIAPARATDSGTGRVIRYERGATRRTYDYDGHELTRFSTRTTAKTGAVTIYAKAAVNRLRWGFANDGAATPINGGKPVALQTTQKRGPDGRFQPERMSNYLLPDEVSAMGPQAGKLAPDRPLPRFSASGVREEQQRTLPIMSP